MIPSEFPLGTFDVVCMNAVFHWLPEKREPLRQIVRVLKKGGRLGISTGSKADPSPLHLIKEQVFYPRAPYNRYPAAAESVAHRVSVEELASLLTEAGFEVKAIEARPIARREMTAEATIRFSEASSLGNFLGHLREELRALARDEIRRELRAVGCARNHVESAASYRRGRRQTLSPASSRLEGKVRVAIVRLSIEESSNFRS